MTASRRRTNTFWALATVVLPLANPVVMVGIAAAAEPDKPGIIGWGILLTSAETLLLWQMAQRRWQKPEERQWRVLLAAIYVIVLSVGMALVELYVLLLIACSDGGCFN